MPAQRARCHVGVHSRCFTLSPASVYIMPDMSGMAPPGPRDPLSGTSATMGSSCQGFSVIGPRDRHDARNHLVAELGVVRMPVHPATCL